VRKQLRVVLAEYVDEVLRVALALDKPEEFGVPRPPLTATVTPEPAAGSH
jgi:hypothetical protein